MGRMLVHPQKRTLTNDTMSGNPSKKIKLDLNSKGDGSATNEDLWGDDITAEEFDFLEFQATQSCKPSTSHRNHDSHKINNKSQGNLNKDEDMKQLQYELEGRVKLLAQSLDRSEKELTEERINRERIISNKMKESQQRETDLQKEVEKLHSVLEFKDQEIKSVSGQLRILKSQLPDRKSASCAESPYKKNFEDFLVSSKPCGNVEASSSKVNSSKKFCRKNKLLPETYKGNNKSTEVLSSILCHRLSVSSPYSSSENLTSNLCVENCANSSFNCNPMSVVQLTNKQRSDELLQYYISCLKNHVTSLKTFASSSCNKTSPLSARRRERMCVSSETVISSLRDIIYLFSSYKSKDMFQFYGVTCSKTDTKTKSETSRSTDKQQVPVSNSSKCDKPFQDSKDFLNLDIVSELFKPLLDLTNPKTFPNEYPKSEEIELSLSALLNISFAYPETFLDKIPELPVYSLLSPHSSVTSVCITLKLLISLCTYKSAISHLNHRDYNCLLCSVASFMCTTLQTSAEKYSIAILLVEDFLSAVLSVHTEVGNQIETSKCIVEVINGTISTVWKYYQMREQISCSTLIVKKGFLLLHFMSLCISNFKEKRKMMENHYISFVSSLLTLSKENPDFREYYDLVHNLWDFQTDNSEFDLDELTPSDETPSSNEMDLTN